MFGALPQPAHMPCPECGASLARSEREEHACEESQRIRFELFQLRAEIELFDLQLSDWLKTSAGRFAVFYAAWSR
jgi:hypothetical protein